MYYPSIFLQYLKNYLKTRLTYRSDFWVEVASDLLSNFMNLLFIFVVFRHTTALAGWSQAEVVFIYGYFMIPYGLYGCFFNLWDFSERYIIKGEMDRILTRPAHNLSQILLENMDPSSLFVSVAGMIVMGSAWLTLGLPLDWYDPFVMVIFVTGSILIYAGIYISLTAISFYSDSPTGIMPMMWNIQNYGRYPTNIYSKMIRWVLTVVLPFAFVGFFPATFFLESEEYNVFAFLTPVVGAAFFLLSIWIWNIGVKKYQGAGS